MDALVIDRAEKPDANYDVNSPGLLLAFVLAALIVVCILDHCHPTVTNSSERMMVLYDRGLPSEIHNGLQ